MRIRVASAVVIAAGVAIGTPVWAGVGDDTTPITQEEVTTAPTDPPPTATDPPPEEPPSTPSPTTTITLPTPTTQEPPTTTGTAATPNTDAPTTPSPRTATTTPTQTTSEPGQSESPPPHDEGAFAAPEMVRVFSGPLLLIVPLNVETTTTTTTTTMPSNKVFVCKYEGTPGVDERLQTGQNPISVAWQPGRSPGEYFNDAQGRSYSLAWDIGQDEPDPNECPPPNTGTTTTSSSTTTSSTSTTTTSTTSTTTSTTSTTVVPTTTTSSTTTLPPTTTSSTTTTLPPTTTTGPVITPFAIEVAPLCPDGTTPEIEITFGNRPDLDGLTGTLTFSTGGSIQLTFDANGTTTIPYPTSAGTGPVTMTYTLGAESVTRTTSFPEACEVTTSTTTTLPTGSTTTTSSPSTTTTSSSTSTTTSTSTTPSTTTSSTTTTLSETFTFGAAGTECQAEVPTIVIEFQNLFPDLAGQTGTLTMTDINGNVVSTQSLVYEPGTTVEILYPGTSVNPDGSIADVPGWILNDDGFWIIDPSDAFLREGIFLTYTVNPTAGPVLVTYPPESSTCANPDGPFPPGVTPPIVSGQLPPTQ